MAEDMDLDLVEISPNASPPVCKIIDYKKFLYEQKRKQKEMKSKQVKVVLKEIRFGPNTDEHDFQFKLKHAIKFLSEGAKLKAFVFFKGRSIIYKDLEIEVEYQDSTIGKYGLTFNGENFVLQSKTTNCLAEDKCGIQKIKPKVSLSKLKNENCSPGSGCC